MGNKCKKCIFPNLEQQDEIQTDSRNKKNNFDSTTNENGMNIYPTQIEKENKFKNKIENLNEELENIKSKMNNDNKEHQNNINTENNTNNNDFLKFDNPITFDNNDDQNFHLFQSNNNKISESIKVDDNNNINKNNEIIEDNDKNENFKIQNSINLNSENNLPKDDFSKYIFEHINKIRKNPKEFIEIIEESKSNIKIDKKGKLIFKHKVKVALSEGEPVFNEAISILERTTQMNELIFNPNICVPIPDNENDIKSKNYLNEKIEEIKQNYPISSYWRDIITDPETSFILMIVDDSSKKTRIKRNDILNPDYKYIGICSVTIGKTFGCYVTFSK